MDCLSLVFPYAFYPPGIYWFDNVTLEPVNDPE